MIKTLSIPDSRLDSYWNHMDSLQATEYTWDLHFPEDIIVFSSKGDIHMKKLVTEWKQLLLFNKSVMAPVLALGAERGRITFPEHDSLSDKFLRGTATYKFPSSLRSSTPLQGTRCSIPARLRGISQFSWLRGVVH